jgi:protein disulfide-isomerase
VKSSRFLLVAAVAAGLLAVSCSKQEAEAAADKKAADKKPSLSAKPGWLTNLDEAQQQAKAKQKLLLMDFTGSDWCGWCIMLDKEVFSKPEFKAYAKNNLVLLEVDFPKMKKLPTETSAQNERLAQQFRIQAFPTVVVMDSNGKPIGALGYMRGGPEVFIAELEKLRKG